MGDMLRTACSWLTQQRKTHCASSIAYSRGPLEATFEATFGQTAYEVQDEFGVLIVAHAPDFLLSAADLAAVFVEPALGDRIEADGKLYEVMRIGGEGVWRYSDPHRQTMRIHTKEIG